jgi:hypothetical protein
MADEHTHKWQPNGTTEEAEVSKSPRSSLDDVLYTAVYSVALCECGETRKSLVSVKDQQFRGGGSAAHVVYMTK